MTRLTECPTLTVKELIEHLQTLPGDLVVVYSLFSEQKLLELSELSVLDLCEPRKDGWVQDKRPDMPTIKYLLFPGN